MNIRSFTYYQFRYTNSIGGVTILELTVSLAITAILSAITLLSLPEMMQSFDRKNARQQFEFDLRRARSETTSAGARGVITFAVGGASYTFGIDNSPYNDPAAADTVMFSRTLPSGLTMTSGQTLIFNSRGYVVDSNGALTTTTVTAKEDGTAYQLVDVYPTGYSHHTNL